MVSNCPTLYIRRIDPWRIGSIHEFYSSTYVLTKSLLWLPRIGDKTADTVDHHQFGVSRYIKRPTVPHMAAPMQNASLEEKQAHLNFLLSQLTGSGFAAMIPEKDFLDAIILSEIDKIHHILIVEKKIKMKKKYASDFILLSKDKFKGIQAEVTAEVTMRNYLY